MRRRCRPGRSPDPDLLPSLQHALERIAEQAERAGRVIKSVHDFVRRRHQAHEVIAADLLIESVLPLVRLQARKSGARVELDIAAAGAPGQGGPHDGRAGAAEPGAQRHPGDGGRHAAGRAGADAARAPGRCAAAACRAAGWCSRCIDAGPGIPAEVAQRLFTPFFTTKPEGMGLGLSLCRTVVEQHGGAMDFENLPADAGRRHRPRRRHRVPLHPAQLVARPPSRLTAPTPGIARRAAPSPPCWILRGMASTAAPPLGIPVVYLVDDETGGARCAGLAAALAPPAVRGLRPCRGLRGLVSPPAI